MYFYFTTPFFNPRKTRAQYAGYLVTNSSTSKCMYCKERQTSEIYRSSENHFAWRTQRLTEDQTFSHLNVMRFSSAPPDIIQHFELLIH